MAKFRKKPVVIEAVQLKDGQFSETTGWLADALTSRKLFPFKGEQFAPEDFYIRTLEGTMRVSEGDFIIQGVQGELYACKPDIFAATYETAEG